MPEPMTEPFEPAKPISSLPGQASTGDDRNIESTANKGTDFTPAAPASATSPQRYTILKAHAQGGLGRVSIARDEKLNRQVALKEIRPDLVDNASLRQRFLTEAEITGQLEHPGIVPIYTLDEDAQGKPYYAMRFIAGRTLAQAITAYHQQPTPLAFRDLLRRFIDVCHTIAYAHSKGVIHRDLKPANIMLGDFAETLVLDWGLAKRMGTPSRPSLPSKGALGPSAETDLPGATADPTPSSDLTEAGQILGTLAYMAPEQAEGHSEAVGAPADIYALGAIFYQLLTGKAPHAGKSKDALLAAARAGTFPPPSQVNRRVNRALEAICLKAMARKPGDRYGAAGDLAQELERWLADLPVQAWREPLFHRIGRWRRRHPVVVASVGVAILVAVASAFVGTVLWIEAETEAQTRERLVVAESHVRDARIASQRGQWRSALENLNKALVAGHSDPVAVELEKIKAYNALNEVGQATQAINALAERSDLGSHQGEVLLWRGDIQLLQGKQDQAVTLIRRALDVGLSAADAAYAQALLAERTPQAVDHLVRTLELDPFHAQAHNQLVITLVLLGRFDEARQRAKAAALLFPDYASFPLIQGVLAALEGDLAAANRFLANLGSQLSAQQQAEFHEMFAGIKLTTTLMDHWDEGSPGQDLQLMTAGKRFAKLFEKVQAGDTADSAGSGVDPLRGDFGPLLRLPPAVGNAYQLAAQALTQYYLGGNSKQTLEKLGQATAIHPEGWLHFVRAQILVDEGRWREAEAAALQATETSSIIPGIRREAFYVAIMSNLGIYVANLKDEKPLRRAIGQIRERLALGPLRPTHAGYLCKAARRAKEYDLARSIIADQLGQRPKNVDWLRWRAEIEYLDGAFARAIAAAEQVLQQAPADKGALDFKKKAIDGLRKVAEKYE